MDEAKEATFRLGFDRRIKLGFHGARISAYGGLFAYRELDEVFGRTDLAASGIGDGRRDRSIRHKLTGKMRLNSRKKESSWMQHPISSRASVPHHRDRRG